MAYSFSNVLCKNIVYIEPLDPSVVCQFIWTHLTIFLILSCHQRSHHYLQSFLLEIVIRAVCYSIARALCKKIVYIGPLLVYLDTVHVAMAIFHNSYHTVHMYMYLGTMPHSVDSDQATRHDTIKKL